MKTRRRIALVLALLSAACSSGPVTPSALPVPALSDEETAGRIAVAFLDRFAASRIEPAACLVDFSDLCRGKRDELSDIEFNRAHYEIIGARLGIPSVRVNAAGTGADIALSCAFDSVVTKCESANCVVGTFEHVAGTCILTGVKDQAAWRLCTSNFASSGPVSASFQSFFSPRVD